MNCSRNNLFISIMTTVLSFAEKSCSLKILFFDIISVENNNSHSCLEDLSHCNIKNSLDSHPTCRVSEKSFWIWRSRISLYCVVPKEIGPWVLQPRQDIDSLTQSCFASVKLPMITLFSSILCWWDSCYPSALWPSSLQWDRQIMVLFLVVRRTVLGQSLSSYPVPLTVN